MSGSVANGFTIDESRVSFEVPKFLYDQILALDASSLAGNPTKAVELVAQLQKEVLSPATTSKMPFLHDLFGNKDLMMADKCENEIATLKKKGYVVPQLPDIHAKERNFLNKIKNDDESIANRMEYFHWLQRLKVLHYLLHIVYFTFLY